MVINKRVKNWKELKKLANEIDPNTESIIMTGFLKNSKTGDITTVIFSKVTSLACKLVDDEHETER